ncbi:MAG: hypothetical protein K4571_00035 [Deltaproteobacteria bacterium]
MNAKPEIHFIGEDNFEAAVVQEQKPVLLLCLPQDDQYAQQINIVMETVAKSEVPLKIGLLNESFIGPFKKRYHVSGTPTFLILEEGREKNRSLGLADEQMLKALIADACPALR